ncbi:MAG: BatD family protein [Caldilineales bacterium]
MNKTMRIFIISAMLLLGALAALPAGAQESAITATINRNQITTDDLLLLTVSVDSSSGSVSQPDLPQLDGFRIIGTSTSTQMTTINGDTSVATVYQYRLQPLHTGDLVIPAITATVNGQQESTQPLPVTVYQGTGQAQPQQAAPVAPGSLPNLFNFNGDPMDLLNQLDQWMQSQTPGGLGATSIPLMPGSDATEIDPPAGLTGQDFYLEAAVDKTNPYQGEQVLYSLRLYRAVSPMGQITYNAPAFSGFWSKELPDQHHYRTEAGGRPYSVTELQTALFPTVAGELTIEPGRMMIPGDFFSAGSEIASQPVTLDVKPLPANAPASFTGAVGTFDITSEVDSAESKVGDTVTQKVTVVGQGNVETVDDPVWPDAAGWRVVDSQTNTQSDVRDGQVVGARSYQRVLMPTAAGDLTLPAIEFSYFDPSAGDYQTVTTESAVVAVSADAAAAAAQPAPLAAAAAASLQPELRPLKEAPASWAVAEDPVTQQPMYWLLWGVPVALVVGQRGWQAYRNGHVSSDAEKRKRQAGKQAEKALHSARQSSLQDARVPGRILHDYLTACLDTPTAGLTEAQLTSLLLARGLSPMLVVSVQEVLMASELQGYAPQSSGGSGAADLLGQVETLIPALAAEL